MSQDFRQLIATGIIKDDREAINKNFLDLRSCSSGSAFPSDNLVEGMPFFNSQTKKLYFLMPDLNTWVLAADFSSGVVIVTKSSSTEEAVKATNDANGKAITGYVAKLEQDADDAFVIRVYDGNNTVVNTITIPETKVDVMQGATSTANGVEGLVPAPSAGDQDKFLRGDGTYAKAGAVDSVNGQTGDVVVDNVPVGTILPFGASEHPVGYLACDGSAVSRSVYADLFAVIGTTYGAGDGSTTFNLPNLNNGSFLEGSNTAGTVKNAGLPNITAMMSNNGASGIYHTPNYTGAFYNGGVAASGVGLQGGAASLTNLNFDASRSNSIYGNSTTVQPKSVTVKYCIKAFSAITNAGSVELEEIAQDYERINVEVSTLNASITGISDYIVESYRSGTEWYEVYKSGKVRQGGQISLSANSWATITFLLEMADTNYIMYNNEWYPPSDSDRYSFVMDSNSASTTSIRTRNTMGQNTNIRWIVEGQGA